MSVVLGLQAVVALFFADGYILRRNSTMDRRVKTVHLTGKARRKTRTIDAIATQLRREIMRDLSDRALQAALAALESIRNRLSEPLNADQEPTHRRKTRRRPARSVSGSSR